MTNGMPFALELGKERRMLALCLELVASVSPENLAKRGDRLPSTLVDPFAIRELADMIEELVPGAAQKVRDETAARARAAAEKRLQAAATRARQIDAERRAAPVDPGPRRALPKYR